MRIENDKFILSPREWEILSASTYSLSIREIARKTKIPHTTVNRFIERARRYVKIRFVPNFRKLNLVPLILLFSKYNKPEKVSVFTTSVRKVFGYKPYIMVFGLVPAPFLEDYIESIGVEPLITIRGYDFQRWHVTQPGTVYRADENTFFPNLDVYKDIIRKVDKPKKLSGDTAPDKIDLAIITWKYFRDAYTPLSETINLSRKYDPNFLDISKQVLSYHYRKHVVGRYWLYNSHTFYFNTTRIPIKVYIFEGSEAHIVANILVTLPYFYFSMIDENQAAVLGQIPCSMHETIYRLISQFDITTPFGDLIMTSHVITKSIPRLFKYSENGKWVWSEEVMIIRNLI